MPVRKAEAVWNGKLRDGKGNMRFGGGAFDGAYNFGSRFEEGVGTNPEELIGAAHAGCFSMAFAGALERAGHPPERVRTNANVHIEKQEGGFRITRVELSTEAVVPGISADDFQRVAQDAKKNCPVSKALTGTEITLDAKLV